MEDSSPQSSQASLRLSHCNKYTRLTSTGTSMRGPTVEASACPLPAPYTATTTAMASSKLLLAAVKLCVHDILYPNLNLQQKSAVEVNVMAK